MSAELMFFKPVDLLREETARNLTRKVRTAIGAMINMNKFTLLALNFT